jgi:hypothetical protein
MGKCGTACLASFSAGNNYLKTKENNGAINIGKRWNRPDLSDQSQEVNEDVDDTDRKWRYTVWISSIDDEE